MKKYFLLDFDHHSEVNRSIAKTIKHFYPANVSSFDAAYNEFPGSKEWNEIISANIGPVEQPPGYFTIKWRSLLSDLRKTTSKQINDTTYGFVPGFSADLILENNEYATSTHVKRIAFAVSLLGPYFSICGIDETFIKQDDHKKGGGYHAINVVTSSPYEEFEDYFNGIKYLIEKNFPNYKFVPFYVAMMHLKDVETRHSMGQEGTVYNALFNHLFNFYTHHKSRGDQFYCMEKNPNITVTLSAPPAPQN